MTTSFGIDSPATSYVPGAIGDWRGIADDVATIVARNAEACDHDGAFPNEDIALLASSGLLDFPFTLPNRLPSHETNQLRAVLTILGRGSLALGRLFEGHVNAVGLVARYGTAANLALLKQEVRWGRASGVWMAGPSLKIEDDNGYVLRGQKLLCSGAGYWRRPLVAAESEAGSILLLPFLSDETPIDASRWTRLA